MKFTFVGASYRARSSNVNAENCINLFPEMSNETAKTVAALYGTPGKRLWANLPGGAIRGVYTVNKTIAVAVSGPNVYTLDTSGNATLVGVVSAEASIVKMASNGTTVVIVTGKDWYSLNPTTGEFLTLPVTAFTGADVIDYIDGYYIFNVPDTGNFQITRLYSTDTDALSFANAEGSPDKVVSLIVNHREVWVFGEVSTEVFYDEGDLDFPIIRINGAFIEQGCAAKFSVAKLDNAVFWLTSDAKGQGMIARSQGYSWTRVSTHALEFAIAGYSRIDDAIAYTYQMEGHSFYQITFPTANKTLVYDAATGLWHERAYRNPVDGSMNRDRGQCQMQFAGETIVGDWENGNLYALDMDTYTDNGDPIVRVRTAPHASSPDLDWIRFARFLLDIEPGVGVIGQSAPTACLQWSDNGGKTWSSEYWATFGELGEYGARALWRRLGKSRCRTFRVSIMDPVKVVILGASVKLGDDK